jgi:hypothetical protein
MVGAPVSPARSAWLPVQRNNTFNVTTQLFLNRVYSSVYTSTTTWPISMRIKMNVQRRLLKRFSLKVGKKSVPISYEPHVNMMLTDFMSIINLKR